MIPRSRHLAAVQGLLRRHPVVAIVGARQVGKTTLAMELARVSGGAARFDLEDPRDLARLEDPMLALEPLRGLVIIDEIQRRPDLFPILRVLADRPGRPATFLILGSASPDLIRGASESLAGRIVYHELTGLRLDEVGAPQRDRLWLRGGLPRAFTAETDAESFEWLRAFAAALLERDVPQLGFRMPSVTMRRFWTMLAHYHGQIWNASEFARAFGVSDTTVRRYLDVLAGMMVVRILPPWHENISKRQVRSPKVYIADTGLLHCLLSIENMEQLLSHPKVGASWEGFAIEEVARRLRVIRERQWFWAAHSGAEVDFLITYGTERWGFEMKRTSAPRVTPSMRNALEILGLRELIVIHAGSESFPLAPKIRAVALSRIEEDLQPIG